MKPFSFVRCRAGAVMSLSALLLPLTLSAPALFAQSRPHSPPAQEIPGGTLEGWRKHREAVRRSPDITRLYTFEGVNAAGDTIANRADNGAEPLRFGMDAVAGAKPDEFRLVPGRWSTNKAIRLDQGFLVAKAPALANKAFTATVWFRPLGQGAHRGNDGATNGMILSSGNGYYEGWRVVSETNRHLSFVVGRPYPTGATGAFANSDPPAEGVWHHLAVTWDGRELRIYLDGDLSAAAPYAGDYTTPTNGEFRIGYADGGVGSLVMDVDEAALYRRALTADEVFQDVYFEQPLSEQQLKLWNAANADSTKRNAVGAAKSLSVLLASPGLGRDVAALVRLRLASSLRVQGKAQAAFQQLVSVTNAPAVATRLTTQARTNLIGLLEENAGMAFPRRTYDDLLARSDVSAADKRELRLSLGHALAAKGEWAAARAEYARLAGDTTATAAGRSLARLCMARTYTLAGNYAGAKTAYQKVKVALDAPSYDRVEADERLREVARLASGRPARDPLDSRTTVPARRASAITFYVAPTGNDNAAGTRSAPFAGLDRARNAIRGLRKNGSLPPGGVTVIVRGGEYRTRSTFQLTEQDSGTKSAPIVYRAADGETPIFNAGTRISGFAPVSDANILARLPESAHAHVVQSDLRAQGVTDLGIFSPGGFGSARGFTTHPLLWLYFNGQAMTLAQWPNKGYVHIADAAPDAKDTFGYAEDRISNWRNEKDAWLYGYWFFNWADSYEKIGAIQPEQKTITLAPPVTTYGDGKTSILKGQRFKGVNLLSELDDPGEWYCDRETGVLYFYPPSDPAHADVEISVFEGRVAELDGVSHVTLQGLTWQNGRGDAIRIRGGSDCLLAGCTIRQFGGNGVEIEGGIHHGLLGCDIAWLGRGGTVVSGGDRKTLIAGRHFIENCHIHHFSIVDHTYTPAVLLSGVGNRIAHNLFHDSYSSAMRIDGNDTLVEYNEVRNVLLESDDQGASDMWADPTYRGTVFRYNYWHDMGNGLGVGQAGIRLDDFISGVVIYGNIFQRCADGGFGAVQINQGMDNLIENNIFADCRAALSGGAGSPEGWHRYLTVDQGRKRVEDVNATQPPYITRYPELAYLGQNPSNTAQRNLAFQCDSFLNEHRLDILDNVNASSNPGFANPERGDFRMVQGSPLANRLSFQPIPFDEIGLYRNQFRHSIPAASPSAPRPPARQNHMAARNP